MTRTFRRLVLPSGEWGWFHGRSHSVLRAPDGKRTVVDDSTLTGRSWNTLERGHWKRTSDGTISPSDVKAYIEQILLGLPAPMLPSPPHGRRLAVARSYQEFVDYCVEHGIDPSTLKYCSSMQQLRGYDHGTPLLLVHGWRDNPDLDVRYIISRFPRADLGLSAYPIPTEVQRQRFLERWAR
jgi:hypothetical protein